MIPLLNCNCPTSHQRLHRGSSQRRGQDLLNNKWTLVNLFTDMVLVTRPSISLRHCLPTTYDLNAFLSVRSGLHR